MENFKEKFKKINSEQIPREKIINMMLYMTILIMPLIVVNISIRRYSIGKIMFLYIIGICLLITLIKDRKITIKKEHIVAIIFLITILISCILSPYKFIAFVGSAARNEGFITFVIYIILFFAASQYLIVSEKSINLMLFVSSIYGLYGILQFYGIDPIQKWLFGEITNHDSIGLIGNRMLFSSYIVLFLTLSVQMYILKLKKRYLLSSIILFCCLLCTLTRGAWITLLVILFINIVMSIKKKNNIKGIIILIIFFICSFAIINITSNNKIIGRVEHTKNEVTMIKDKGDNVPSSSINARRIIIKLYLKAYLDKPLIGTGPDTFYNRLFDDYTKDLMEKVIYTGEATDKAHNEYLEYAVSCGIFTLLSYLFLTFLIVMKILKKRDDNKFKIMLMIILSYLIQSFFNISDIGTAPLFWIALGYSVKIIYEKK